MLTRRYSFTQISALLALFLLLAQPSAQANDRANDRADIIELSSQYAWGIDTLDRKQLARVFMPDARAHYTIVNDSPIELDERLEGFDAIYSWLKKSLGHRKGHDGLPWHFVTNHLVSLQGDRAELRFYMHNRPMAAGGVYTFQVVRTAEGWRVQELLLEEQIWDLSPYSGG